MLLPVSIETHADLEGLRRVGRVVALTLEETRRSVEPGVTTAELDAVAAGVLARHGARSAPNLVHGFPAAICIEPTISAGGGALLQDADGWTVRTRDGSLTAHAEHTVVVTRCGSPLVLTSAS